MSVRITAVHMVGGLEHQHIATLRWINEETGAEGVSTREAMVEWITSGGVAYTRDAVGDQPYLRVRTTGWGTKYVQTYADGIWKDNLLALPRF
ncbi:MAG TPA: DUF3892 domain-containing protein [Candidatus Eremiobacteraceae bacterium]|nr:DUF3892 domain-containing protein [Candidatus Eremiobacteraceae bacterium]